MLALYIAAFVFVLLLLPMLFGQGRRITKTVPLEVRRASSDDFDPHTVPVFEPTWKRRR